MYCKHVDTIRLLRIIVRLSEISPLIYGLKAFSTLFWPILDPKNQTPIYREPRFTAGFSLPQDPRKIGVSPHLQPDTVVCLGTGFWYAGQCLMLQKSYDT